MKIKVIVTDEKITPGMLEPYLPLLPEKRREKIARYRCDDDKITSAVAGLLIYHETFGRELCYNQHEKPYIKDCDDCFFSLSHSGRRVAIATDREEIGLDIERIRDNRIEKLSRRFFCQNEQEYIEKSANPPLAFTEVWTRKEAYLKCKGTGITEELMSSDTTSTLLSEYLFTVPLDGYVLSVCTVRPFPAEKPQISFVDLKDIIPR